MSLPPSVTRLLAALGLSSAILYLWFESQGWVWLQFSAKLVPVACLIAWVSAWRGRYAQLVITGLSLSLVGDAMLAVPRDWFLFGLIAFLMAHLCYVAAFIGVEKRLRLDRLAPVLVWMVGFYLFLLPGLGGMAIPVAVYAVAIGTMLWRSLSLAPDWTSILRSPAALGALSFGLSDSSLAIARFHGGFAGAGILVIVSYWLGQYGLARSVREFAFVGAAESLG